MGWHGPRGACGCCEATDICNNCDDLTFFTISGLTSSDCASGCDGKNGTYVFRTVGTYFDTGTSCGWFGSWSGDNCGLDDTPLKYIGVLVDSCGFTNGWTIDFRSDGSGGIIVRVIIDLQYNVDTSVPGTGPRSGYNAVFEGTFDDCASASGFSLLLSSSNIQDCQDGGTGDLCDLLGSASIGLG